MQTASPWTSQDIARLKAAISSGQLSVRLGDRQVTYQSAEAMLKVLARMEAEVASTTTQRRPATSRYSFQTLRGG